MASARDRLEDFKVIRELEKKVRNYFKDNPYPGFFSDFVLDKLEVSRDDGTQTVVYAYPKNMGVKIEKPNREWNNRLAKIGSEYKVKIILPWEIYRI